MKPLYKYSIIACAVLIILMNGGVLAFVVLHDGYAKSPATARHADTHKTVSHVPAINKTTVFAEIPQFIISLPQSVVSATGAHYVEVGLSFSTDTKAAVTSFKALLPIIKAALITDITNNGSTFVSGGVGAREKIVSSTLPIVNKIVSMQNAKLGKQPFIGSYLTNYVVQ